MRPLLEIALTGVAAATMHPLRTAVTICCLCAALVPYATAMAISNGIVWEAQLSISEGADLYVSGLRFGRPSPLPMSTVARIEAIDGVTSVVPRIAGEVLLGKDQVPAVLVGLPVAELSESFSIVEGDLPKSSTTHELVVGTELAQRLRLKTGSFIPPFYNSATGDRVSKIVGIFRSNAPFWQANLIFTTFETASVVFDQPEFATELLVRCRPGYADRVRELILRNARLDTLPGSDRQRLRVITRQDARAFLPRGLLRREGIFNLHYVMLIVSSILVVLVTSGFGLAERSREIGILKATGWQTDEVLLRSFAESVAISLTGALLALTLSFIWLRLFNGVWIANVFVAGVATSPTVSIPYRLLPMPVVITLVLSLVITMTGSLYSAWRTAVASPSSVMRS